MIDTFLEECFHFPVFFPSPFSEIILFPIRDFQDLLLLFFSISSFFPFFLSFPALEKFEILKIYHRINRRSIFFSRNASIFQYFFPLSRKIRDFKNLSSN